MNVQFRNSFLGDIKGLSDRLLKERIKAAIAQVESARTLRDVANLKKLTGRRDYYRIRIGDYRIALTSAGGDVTFVRCLHRRDIYRYLP